MMTRKQEVEIPDTERRVRFIKALLSDLHALEHMIEAAFMKWERARYVVVERGDGDVVGLITPWSLLRIFNKQVELSGVPIFVDAVIDGVRFTVTADTPVIQAISLMENQHVGCLPVVEDSRLIGILTHEDVLHVSRELLHGDVAAQPVKREPSHVETDRLS